MDIFVLLFILSFIALLVTLVVMSIRKRINKGKERTPLSEKISISKEQLSQIGLDQLNNYSCSWDLATSMMKQEVNETQEKWKETIPKHSTRIKLRASRKLRNKQKGKKK
jgi:hypothetical protein